MQKRLLLLAVFGEQYVAEYRKKGHVPQDSELEEVLSTLTPMEKFVLEHRFADERMTLAAVGKICPRRSAGPDGRKIGFTPERARQIEASALRRLRHPTRGKKLWPLAYQVQHGRQWLNFSHGRLDRWVKELGV